MHTKVEEIPAEVESDEMVLREMHLGDMNVGYETFNERLETDEMFKDLPDGRCQSPHWGYVLEGEFTVRYADEEETVRAGEAYHMKPGHNVTVEPGTKLIEFSPIGEFAETLEAASEAATSMEVTD